MRTIILLLVIALASQATAGVTIHYEGTAASPSAVAKIIEVVTAAAKKNKWTIEDTSAKRGRLLRVIDEKNKDYEGKVTGVVIRIGGNCEPLHFQFGDDLFMQDFVKTQFAGADVHIQIVEMLESIRPFVKQLTVGDEGEFWGKRDRAILEGHIQKINSVIADMKKKNPKARVAVRLESGRVADVIQ
ncbi:MAG TPA: hypothetical protein VI454_06165 [Verrucomicrobiae bacterium]